MIEVLISDRIQGETYLKKCGDIIIAKLEGSPWGTMEQASVVKWPDNLLEAELQSMKAGGETCPVIIHPYAGYEVIGGEQIMVERSLIYVDIDNLELEDQERIRSRRPEELPIAKERLTTKIREVNVNLVAANIISNPIPRRPIPPTWNKGS